MRGLKAPIPCSEECKRKEKGERSTNLDRGGGGKKRPSLAPGEGGRVLSPKIGKMGERGEKGNLETCGRKRKTHRRRGGGGTN